LIIRKTFKETLHFDAIISIVIPVGYLKNSKSILGIIMARNNQKKENPPCRLIQEQEEGEENE
jgi:hypothetical protein